MTKENKNQKNKTKENLEENSKNKKTNKGLVLVLALVIILAILALNSYLNKRGTVRQMTSEEVESAVLAGNFVASSLRGIDNSDIVLGKKNAKVKLIVYEDLSSYFSAEFDKTLDQLRAEVGDKVAIAFRPYANKMFPNSIYVNLWSQCANDQGKFFEARDLLLSEAENDSLSEEYLDEYSQRIGLNQDLVNECLRTEKYLSKLENIKNEAERFDVYGVPTIFVDSEMIVGARPFDDIVDGDGKKIEGMKNIVYRHLD